MSGLLRGAIATQRRTSKCAVFSAREIFIDRKPPGYAFAGDHERWTEAERFERLTPA